MVTGATGVDAAHIRYADRRFLKRQVGAGEKPHDMWTLPLTRSKHTEQHSGNEKQFWEYYGIDPIVVCAALYVCYTMFDGDDEMARLILNQKGRLT